MRLQLLRIDPHPRPRRRIADRHHDPASRLRIARRLDPVPQLRFVPGITALQALTAAHAIPFADNTFDVVTCLAALYLIPDPLPVVDELVRVTRPGGEIVVFTSVATELTSLPGVQRAVALSGYRIFDRSHHRAR